MANKGGQYERDCCRQFTEWWTGDPDHDVVVWRTSQSGGRATTRRKKGKKTTKAHIGDITAVDECAIPLTGLITFEMKRGYKDSLFSGLLDRLPHRKQAEFESFLEQTWTAQKLSNTPHWLLVHRRDSKRAVAYMDLGLAKKLFKLCGYPDCKDMRFYGKVKLANGKWKYVRIYAILLDNLLDWIEPGHIKRLYKRHLKSCSKK